MRRAPLPQPLVLTGGAGTASGTFRSGRTTEQFPAWGPASQVPRRSPGVRQAGPRRTRSDTQNVLPSHYRPRSPREGPASRGHRAGLGSVFLASTCNENRQNRTDGWGGTHAAARARGAVTADLGGGLHKGLLLGPASASAGSGRASGQLQTTSPHMFHAVQVCVGQPGGPQRVTPV